MSDDLAEVRPHGTAAHALLERLDGATASEAAGEPSGRLGVQVETEAMAELLEMATHVRLTPGQTLKLALRALAVELAKGKPARVGLVGGNRLEKVT